MNHIKHLPHIKELTHQYRVAVASVERLQRELSEAYIIEMLRMEKEADHKYDKGRDDARHLREMDRLNEYTGVLLGFEFLQEWERRRTEARPDDLLPF